VRAARVAAILTGKLPPEDAFTFREIVPQEVRPLTEQRLKLELLTGLLLRGDLQCSANQPGYALWREGMTCARRSIEEMNVLGGRIVGLVRR
jgi:hypothetical protein